MNDSNNRDQIEQIKSRIDIVTLIEKYLALRSSGRNYTGLCPFHSEKTPSFFVNPDTQRYKCFGCGESGDIFNFLQKLEGMDFYETLKKLAEEAGVELTQRSENPKTDKIHEINKIATQFYIDSLKREPKAVEYLKKRQFDAETIAKFEIGYAPGYNSLLKYFTSSKARFTKQDLLASGIVAEKDGRLRDRFINRIIFPLQSTSGKYIGFSARQMPGDDYGPKYLNTPETEVFHKRESLFAMDKAKNNIRKEDLAILCEGQTDVIALHQLGMQNSVAPLGTGLTENQVDLIKRYSKNLLFLFDSDRAGQEAVKRGFQIGLIIGVNTFAVNVPEPYKDIDELRVADPEKARDLPKLKKDAFTYIIINELKDKDLTNLEDFNYIKNLHHTLLKDCPTPDLFQFFSRKFEKITGIKIDQEATTAGTKGRGASASAKKSFTNIDLHSQEVYLIAIALRYDFLESIKNLDPEIFTHPDVRELINTFKTHPDSANALAEAQKTPFVQDLMLLIDTLPQIKSEPRKILNEVYNRIKKNYYSLQIQRIEQQLRVAEEVNDKEQIKSLTSRYLKLIKFSKS